VCSGAEIFCHTCKIWGNIKIVSVLNSVVPGRSEGNIKIVSVFTANVYFLYKRAVNNKL
jgi:hypothetical protein